MEEESKTSDEILEELFSALNVPLSPKRQKQTLPESQENSQESDGSEDKEADSKSSDSEEEEEESREQDEGKESKTHKHKSKKKKEKKKKKKKHKKKDDEGRHKSKRKHSRKSSVADSLGESVSAEKVENFDKTEDEGKKPDDKSEEVDKKSDVISGQTESICSVNHNNNHNVEVEVVEKLPTSTSGEVPLKSTLKAEEPENTTTADTMGKTQSYNESGDKENSTKKHPVTIKSPQRSLPSSKSLRSRSRSASKLKLQKSKSRSRTRSRSRSESKHDSKHSRSRSRTKSSSRYRSRAKSPSKLRQRKRSRSRSRSFSPKSFKRRYSSSRSRSPLFKSSGRQSRSYSRSLSPKFSRRRHRRSHSRSPRSSRYRSRSRSGSHKRKHRSRSRSGSRKRKYRSRSRSGSFERKYRSRSESESRKSKFKSRSRSGSLKKSPIKGLLNSSNKVMESSIKSDPPKDQHHVQIDLNSIPTPDVRQSSSSSTLAVSLESIPLPVPPTASKVPDPSSIPLPQPVETNKEELNKTEAMESKSTEIDVCTIPVPGASSESPVKEEAHKSADAGGEKNKAKTIIIKSLKDSLIYMQAQEEAERRAKVKQNDETDDVEDDDDDDPKNSDAKEFDDAKDQETKDAEGKESKEPEAIPEENEKVPEKMEATKSKENEMEDGEIVSENEVEDSTKTKSHKKKSKKDKDKSKDKEKKKSKKDKSKDKKKQMKERSRSKEKSAKSRSRSRERSKHTKSSSNWHREHESDRRHRRYSRSRSHSRDRRSRLRHRSYSRSRSRSRSRSGRKRDCVSDLRDKVTRKRLLEIARRNAVYLMQNGCLPLSVEQEQLVKIKTSGKSVEELTDFCKQLVASGNYSDVELSDPSLSSEEEADNPDKPFNYTRHPFNVKDKPILMNIRNAPMLPTKTNAERLADHAKLREQFPVSSGSQHRNKGETSTTDDKVRADNGWVPVSPKEKKNKEEDSVFSKEKGPTVDISQIVSSRLSAMRKLQDNPNDMEALKTLHNVQKDMETWALSKQEPGQFTGSTGVKVLSQEELSAGQQAWVRKVKSHMVGDWTFILNDVGGLDVALSLL